jgi:DNA mismatch repair protein MutS
LATKKKAPKETPLMKQYNAIKVKYPEAMLLFRVGDFYETFGADAVEASKILGIVLTNRANGSSRTELAGFPHHSLDTYLPKLVRAGQRVAICDQLEDPKMTKTIVKRGVTELVTPGVALNDQVLNSKSNNFLAAVHFGKKENGVAFLDVSTGEFYIAQGNTEYIDKLLQNFNPSEVLYQRQKKRQFIDAFGENFYMFHLEDWVFQEDYANDSLLNQFNTKSLKGFGIEDSNEGIIAGGAALFYLSETQHDKVSHITSVSRIEEDNYMWMDKFTIRNLELYNSAHHDATTLLDVIDKTISPMGGRTLKMWLALPLKHVNRINERLDVVNNLIDNDTTREDFVKSLKNIGDVERLISKVATHKISPREAVQLKKSLDAIVPLKELALASGNESLVKIGHSLNFCDNIRGNIGRMLSEDAPVNIAKGNAIATGISTELDELRQIAFSGKDYLDKLCERESERTGISSLKIAFNNVFGYYIEVRNTHRDKVPEEWIRKQTLVNAERYITEELKEYENKILGAEEKIGKLEQMLFNELIELMIEEIVPVQRNAQLVGQIDVLTSFAYLAIGNNYTKPSVDDSTDLEISEGRHPVIEKQLADGEEYISNNVTLNRDQQQMIMITGPNMSGKSALLRQTALIVIMAQMGSYVPAKHAKIGVVDKVFTRVGASDNISSGESTFMVEMNETASILNNISDRSLILLDEIGRGTSTYDGISIAWSISEFLHESKARPKTLFATHYHELNDMTDTFKRIKNYNVSVKEVGDGVIFMRKLVPGGSHHSFGIHVAKMAGMPSKVITRANDILKTMEKNRGADPSPKVGAEDNMQLSFFQLDDPTLQSIKDEIIDIDINTLTPIEALMKLNEIKKMIGG